MQQFSGNSPRPPRFASFTRRRRPRQEISRLSSDLLKFRELPLTGFVPAAIEPIPRPAVAPRRCLLLEMALWFEERGG
jgi:hypothetical protein